MPKARFVFFDVGNTLLFPNRDRIMDPLRKLGYFPTLDQWHAVERATKPQFDLAAQKNASIDHSFWWFFYTRLLDVLSIPTDDTLLTALLKNTQNSANWDQIRPGTCETLGRIAQNHGIAVISNADGKIADVLSRCGIAACFHSITDSGIVGFEKPHRAIFEAALQKMQAPPGESLYVGDVYSVDYLGAQNAGMQAVLFDVSGAYRDRNLPRVESLEELERWLSNA
jgi:putative hydrolase of the HAD superfamily